MSSGWGWGGVWGGLPFMRVLSLSGTKMEQNTSAWILSAEISLECHAGRNTVRLSLTEDT